MLGTLLMDRDKKYMRIASGKAKDVGFRCGRVRGNISGWVTEKGVLFVINATPRNPVIPKSDPDIASMLFVPLISENKVLASLR